jgi:hypothetical protein
VRAALAGGKARAMFGAVSPTYVRGECRVDMGIEVRVVSEVRSSGFTRGKRGDARGVVDVRRVIEPVARAVHGEERAATPGHGARGKVARVVKRVAKDELGARGRVLQHGQRMVVRAVRKLARGGAAEGGARGVDVGDFDPLGAVGCFGEVERVARFAGVRA